MRLFHREVSEHTQIVWLEIAVWSAAMIFGLAVWVGIIYGIVRIAMWGL